MFLRLFVHFSIALHLLLLGTISVRFAFCHAHFKKPHIGGWLHSDGFYFVEKSLVFLGYLVIRIVRINFKIIDVFGLFSQLRFWMIDWVNCSFLEINWWLTLVHSAVSHRLRLLYVFDFFSTLLYIMFPKFWISHNLTLIRIVNQFHQEFSIRVKQLWRSPKILHEEECTLW